MKSGKLASKTCISLIVCMFLLFSVVQQMSYANLGWFDPDSATPKLYSDYIAACPTGTATSQPAPSTTPAPGETEGEEFTRRIQKAPPRDKSILIVVEEDIFLNPGGGNIQEALIDYIDYLMEDYSGITTILWKDGFEDPEELRSVIENQYNTALDPLAGCIFIGNLPTAWFRIDNDIPNVRPVGGSAQYPTDVFFMDVNGEWIDSPPIQDGLYDVHQQGPLPYQNMQPEVWVSRIAPSGADINDRILLINQYFTKNFEYREAVKNGERIDNFGARCYADSNFPANTILTQLQSVYTDDTVVLHNDDAVISGTDYLATINPAVNIYEFFHTGCTSSAFYHTFGLDDAGNPDDNDGSVSESEIAGVLDKQAIFYNVVGSSAARFIESDYLGNAYIFENNTEGLVFIGSTKNGGMQDTKNFYTDFQNGGGPGNDGTVGECFRKWVEEFITDEIERRRQRFCYGMVILGDPTLKRSADPAAQAIIRAIYGTNNLAWYLENINSQPDTLAHRSYKPATAALAVLALLNWDTPVEDPAVTAGINYLLSRLSGAPGDSVRYIRGTRNATYNTASAILALAATHNSDYHDELRAMRAYLIGNQWTNSSDPQNGAGGFGGIGYGNHVGNRADNSNTQFAIMGINIATWELYRELTNPDDITAEKDIPKSTYLRCLQWLNNIHKGSGGHAYRPSGTATHTMTAAAAWNYLLIIDGIEHDTDTTEVEHRLNAALAWLAARNALNLRQFNAARYYYVFTLAKTLRMSGATVHFGGNFEWYDALASQLVSYQAGNGLWNPYRGDGQWGIPAYTETGFAVAALQVDRENPLTVAARAFILNSHADLHVYDSRGNHTGYNKNIQKVEEVIPGSRYLIRDTWYDNQLVPYEFFRQEEDAGNPHPTNPNLDPDKRFEQEIIIYNPLPDTYRIEMEGTSAGEYELTIESQKEGEILQEVTYEGEIEEIVSGDTTTFSIHATYETVANIVSGAPITANPPEKSPRLEITPESVLCIASNAPQENDQVDFIFTIKETGGETGTVLEVEKIYLTGIFNDIDVTDFIYPEQLVIKNYPEDTVFTHAVVSPGGEKQIYVEIPVSRGFEGPSTATLQVVSNGGNKNLEITIQTNRPPEADAGEDQVVYAGALGTPDAWVTLDASESSDPDGDELSFAWYEDGNLLSTEMTFDYAFDVGVHTIILKVSDGVEETEDDVIITVNEPEKGTLWITPVKIYRHSKATWVKTTLIPPDDMTPADIDMDYKIRLYTPSGECIEAVRQYIIPKKSGPPQGDVKCYDHNRKVKIIAWFKRKDLLETVPENGVVKCDEVCKLTTGAYINGSNTILIKGPSDKTGYLKLFPFSIERTTKARYLTSWLVLPRKTSSEDIDPEEKVSLILPSGEILEPEFQKIYPPIKPGKEDTKHGYSHHHKKRKRIISYFSMETFLENVPDDGVIHVFVKYDLKSGESVYGITRVKVYSKH